VLTLGVGQRADVLVKASYKSDSAFWMRSNISTPCSASKQPYALAAIYYDKADTGKAPASTAWDVADPGNCANDDLTLGAPYFSIKPSAPSTTIPLEINSYVNATGSFLWTLGGISQRANYNYPVLLLAAQGNTSYPSIWNVHNFGTNSSVRIIINNKTPASHPMHLHGHNMYILSEGSGDYDGSTIMGNAQNPQRRDVQMVRAQGHLVVQYDANNPGVWPFHCHIAWHASGGLYANFLERPNDLVNKLTVPLVTPATCDAWNKYTKNHAPNQIDSGI
jgi:FtsP/CotA-like multicopper oxidase with cupredoxin domain